MIKEYMGDYPDIPESAFVSEMAYVFGDVTLGEDVSIWPFVCIRGDVGPTVVGDESNIQDHTMLHECEIGERVTVGHNCVIDQSEVEDDCLIGISSSVLRGATVESNSIVAAGAVVREGQTIPEGHMAYGVPAEVEPLNEAQQSQIPMYYQSYKSLSENYREEGGFDARD
ncbi:MAG: gamma carbonic anhydrase family protein [Halobacteria archaeon]|nr:gamma carbonic anhydrase family protein [Halobacteria archaeon]